jgi:hypothetical protein
MKMNVEKMSDAPTVKTMYEICDALKSFIASNPESAKLLLSELIDNVLTPLSEDDFFGTEGWEHAFSMD